MNRRGVFEAFLPGTELASRENDRTDARGASENGRSNGEIGEFDGGVGGAVPRRAETAETGDVVVERRRRAPWFASNGRDAPNSEDDETMTKRWFPGLERSGTRCDGGRRAKFRILCFPNAGNTEDMFTSEGTGERRAKSPLLEWAKKNDAEVLSVQYPGRANRKSETYAFEIWQIVEPLLHVVASKLDDVPYVVVGHSVGAWVAFEMLQLLRGRGIRMPEHVFLSSFPFPDIPHARRGRGK